MYFWKDMCPLTAEEALCAHEKGLQILALSSGCSRKIKGKREIRRHAKHGGLFAVNREELIRSETYYIAYFTVYDDDCNPIFDVNKQYKTRDDAKEDCRSLLTKALLAHGLHKDGKHWTRYELFCYQFGTCTGLDEMDEGEIVMHDKIVTDVPAGFWLPF